MKQALIKLHLSVILAGATGLLGKLISLDAIGLTWYRTMIAAFLSFLLLLCSRKLIKISRKEILKITSLGALLGLHWIFFLGSIKASNVSIGVVSYALVGLFTALLEPLLNKTRCSFREIAFSLITLLGIMFIFQFDTRYRTGIILGVIGAFLGALFTILNKKASVSQSSGTLIFYEMLGGFACLSLMLICRQYMPSIQLLFPSQDTGSLPLGIDWIYLFILASFCTLGLYTLQIQALRKLSAFTVNLTYNLEPVYSIVLAMIIFNEAKELNFSFYVGLFCIIVSVFLQTVDTVRKKKCLANN